MLFNKAIIAFAATVAASPLAATSELVARGTDPNGVYPVCSASSKTIGRPFYLAAIPYGSDPAYGAGFVQQVQDGQMFIGSNSGVDPPNQSCESATKPFFFFADNGLLWDNHGRQVEVSSGGQIQANYGGGSSGYAVCSSDSTNYLTYSGVNTMYACQNGGTTSYRLYPGSQTPSWNNANCNAVYLQAQYLD